MIFKALHHCVLFLLECNILVPIPLFILTIIMRISQLSFCFFDLPDHMVGAKIWLMDIDEHSLTILHTLLLFHVYMSSHVHENLKI